MHVREGEPVGRSGRRTLFIVVGSVSVAIGAIGVVVPGLPTTVFLIVASYCFARSSPTLDRRLHESRWLGPGLRRYRESGGMTVRAKALALLSMWAGIAVSSYWLASVSRVAQALVLVLGGLGSLVILVFVPTVPETRQ